LVAKAGKTGTKPTPRAMAMDMIRNSV
jgi:hypothetical protein